MMRDIDIPLQNQKNHEVSISESLTDRTKKWKSGLCACRFVVSYS